MVSTVPCLNCLRLDRRLAELLGENANLRAPVEHRTRLLDEPRRAGKRQAAPFAHGTPKPQPNKPGRKPGKDYGPKAQRLPPEQLDE